MNIIKNYIVVKALNPTIIIYYTEEKNENIQRRLKGAIEHMRNDETICSNNIPAEFWKIDTENTLKS